MSLRWINASSRRVSGLSEPKRAGVLANAHLLQRDSQSSCVLTARVSGGNLRVSMTLSRDFGSCPATPLVGFRPIDDYPCADWDASCGERYGRRVCALRPRLVRDGRMRADAAMMDLPASK